MARLLRFFPHLLIFSYLVRLLHIGASFSDALVMLVFGAIYVSHLYLEHVKEPEPNAELKAKIEELEKTQETIKNKVGSISMAGAFRK